jgi:DNA end-binding protein Ku
MLIEDELDAVTIESNHTIEIDSFVPRSQIDDYFDSPYYLVPNEPVGQEAFAVIRDAMRGKDMVALGRIVLAKHERVVMLQPWIRASLERRCAIRMRCGTPKITSMTSPT